MLPIQFLRLNRMASCMSPARSAALIRARKAARSDRGSRP